MKDTKSMCLDELQYCFVVKRKLANGSIELSFSSYAPFRDDIETFPFDTEMDAALFLLEEARQGVLISENDREAAQAIIHEEKPLFLYETRQGDGTLLLSLHDCLPPDDSSVTVFGSRAPRRLARFLLRRLHENQRVQVSPQTLQQAQHLLDK
ncbi:hypothetical protein EPA93_00700 [Ktedonosporobacter rubrisoli]|uniref:Uncharacterized protein n=1 Tax=Ktedonosporobacter rubrisoli TaxID=2509675 RepID=A0A4P6JHS4_KTERU|nr:hypothetical protein [Ktedonosporobacter rubrisoli]QBD74589.1 hypothetical protein EPA93_00700 [Ktedonosporobacter rubrisoli]